MSEHSPKDRHQNLNISGDASLKNVQIGGIAGRDLKVTQIQGKVVYVTIYDRLVGLGGLSSADVHWTDKELRYRKVLLDRVKKIWIKGILEKSLHKQALIELGLEKQTSGVSSQVSSSQEFTSESITAFSEGTEESDILQNRGHGHPLLIVGKPGSGKTTVLLKLAKSLIEEAENDSSKLIPIVFKLSSWSNKKQSIREWLVEEMQEQYRISDNNLSKKWIKDEKLILLLDGLDEVQEKHRNDCVKALNHFTETHGITEMVVSCRIRQYQKLSEPLNLQSVVKIQPLTSEQIDEYLKQAGKKLAGLKTLLQQDNELQKLASSPLFLTIMSLTYQDYTLEQLRNTGLSTNFYSVLFNNYIDRMLHQRQSIAKRYAGIGKKVVIFTFALLIEPKKTRLHRHDTKSYRLGLLLLQDDRYSRPQLLNWLIWLAQRMSQKGQTIFLIEKMQPDLLERRTQRLSYYFTVLLISGLLSSLTGFVHIPLQPVDNWKYALATGLLGGFCVPLYYVWDYFFEKYWTKNNEEIKLVEQMDWSWKERLNKLIKYLPISLMIGLIIAVPCAWLEIQGIMDFYKVGIEKNLIGRSDSISLTMLILIYTILVGVVIVFIYGFTADLPSKEISKEIYPNQGIFISLQNSLFIGLTDWIISGLFFFLIGYYIQTHPMIQALKYGIGYGLIAAVFLAICSSSGRTCIKHFALRLILYKNKLIPCNYAEFLDDTNQLLFLKKAGIAYEFFHQEFQKYLTNIDKKSTIRHSDS